MTRGQRILLIVIGVLSFLVHFFFQGAAWALHPGNMPDPPPDASTLLWDVLSLPLFALIPNSFLNEYFFVSLALNSALWTGACMLLTRRILNYRRLKRERAAQESPPARPV